MRRFVEVAADVLVAVFGLLGAVSLLMGYIGSAIFCGLIVWGAVALVDR